MSSEDKGADQLCSYFTADLRLCFRLYRLLVFPCGGSNTPGPLYNMLHYNTVLDITLISVGPQLDYFAICLSVTLIITQIG